MFNPMFDWKSFPKPIVGLAPMADMTDLPFCLICKEHNAPVIFREMVSSEAIVRDNAKTWHMTEIDDKERPLVQQIFGKDPTIMADAARLIMERSRPDAIDINMGCPVYNIVSSFNGASLIKDPDRAVAIVRAVKAAVNVPVSVKTRLGWKEKTECVEFVKRLEDAGADLITIHGRTKEQAYAGKADWAAVSLARNAVPSLPFLVNGDITNAATAKQAMAESGADGVLIGRGALGNPWIFQELNAETLPIPPLLGRAFAPIGHPPDKGERGGFRPSLAERIAVVKHHAALHVQHHGETSLIKLRKHLPWYFKGMPGMKDLRSALVRVSTLPELEAILDAALIKG
ncbi:MAG: tRNA-dihydrouridine synthase [bacterium]|nr:tRNA-dihydrouridine synthase [bacterium]